MVRKRGVLSNAYVPLLLPIETAKLLARLHTNSLFDLCLFWCKWTRLTKPDKLDQVYDKILQLKKQKRAKRKLMDNILSNYWPQGMNLLQISQLDVQTIVDKPSTFSWVSSTAKTSSNEKFIINLNSQLFLQQLIKNLTNLYLSHIYVSKHPHFPLILVRIQVFDYSIVPLIHSKKQKYITSRRPFFLAIPLNSPHIIHTETDQNDTIAQLVLQAIENCLSTSNQLIRLARDELESSVRNLETMHIFKGVSRFAESLGSWAPYADGTVDISPLGDPNKHFIVNQDKIYDDKVDNQEDKEMMIRRKIAHLRFTGSELPLQSERIYEDDRPIRKRKLPDDQDLDPESDNPYKSIAPVQRVQSQLVSGETLLKIRFEGNDVFAGLHELCVSGVIDPRKMPGWLTGEEGNKSVKIVKADESESLI